MPRRLFLVFTVFSVLVLLCRGKAARADQARLACTADTTVSSYESERDFNYGRSARLRLKGIEMIALLGFDTASVRGWKVERATLHLRYAGSDRKLRTIGISTISAPWQEGTGTAEKRAGECCFNWSALGTTRWAGDSTDFTDVSFTAGNTIACYSDIRTDENGWFEVNLDPRIVQAMAAGISYGMAVSDEKGQTAANNDVFSREQSGSEPYLVVTGRRSAAPPPNRIADLSARPDADHADFSSGAIQISFTAPKECLYYSVRVQEAGREDADVISPSLVPLPKPGERQTFTLTGRKPGATANVIVQGVGLTGELGPAARVSARASAARSRPEPLVKPISIVKTEAIDQSAGMTVWAYPETEKAHPISGNVLEEVGAKAYSGPAGGSSRVSNAVWSGGGVSLSGARGEFVAFNLVIEARAGSLKQVQVIGPTDFSGTNGRNWRARSSTFREWYVRDGDWFPEICVPLKAPFDIPATDNAVPGQRCQSVYVEILIPRDAAPGNYSGALSISAAATRAIKVPVSLAVNALTMPDALSFDISLNGYGTVGGPFGVDDRTAAYRAIECEYHRMAHAHRATLALLGYSHTGNITSNYAPPLEGHGAGLHVRDWSAWDEQFGPYLDGSAFADLPRKGVPVSHVYLPFHEAWPVDIRNHYAYRPMTTDYPATISEHALAAPTIEMTVDNELSQGFTAVSREFADHFRARGWNRTMFQFYQNDKHYYKDPKQGGQGTSWWLLDEPNHRDDWLALAYFARLWKAGIGRSPGVTMAHREDISRPQWQRDYLDGLVDLMVVSGELYTKGPRLREMKERLHVRYWNYGSANPVRRSNTEAEAWAVRAWLAGADAIVPWQTIGSDENFVIADETALLLPGKRFGIAGPVASLRLKALRRAQQDVEYLTALAQNKGWGRDQLAVAIGSLLRMNVSFQKANDQDAGNYRFGPLRAADFSNTRRAAASAIQKR